MFTKSQFFNYLKNNYDREFSKEELINRFSKSFEEEDEVERLLSEIEVESTYGESNLVASCKAGTVYYRWTNNEN